MSVCLSFARSACFSFGLFVSLSVCWSSCTSVGLPVSVCLLVYLSVSVPVCLSVCLTVGLLVYPCVFWSVCLSVCPSVDLCVCLYLSFRHSNVTLFDRVFCHFTWRVVFILADLSFAIQHIPNEIILYLFSGKQHVLWPRAFTVTCLKWQLKGL